MDEYECVTDNVTPQRRTSDLKKNCQKKTKHYRKNARITDM